ncbi:MAG: helix-turn-helix domain-containing protein [Rhizomicrobium sp.]
MRLARTFGTNVRRRRKELGFTQEALADAVRLAPTYVGQIERGQRNPTLEVVERFAKTLKVDPLELLQ